MKSRRKIFSNSGTPLVNARLAADRLGCAPDYIGKLCREGKLKGTRIRNAWFVEEESLAAFVLERGNRAALRAQELSQLRQQENRAYRFDRSGVLGRMGMRVQDLFVGDTSLRVISRTALVSLLLGALLASASVLPRGYISHSQNPELAASIAQVQSPFFAVPLSFGNFGNIFADIAGDWFGGRDLAQNTEQGTSFIPPPAVSAGTSTTIIEQNTYPVVDHTIEQVITTTTSGVSEDELTQKLQELTNSLQTQISGISSGTGGAVIPYAAAFDISKLSNVTLTNVTVNGVSGLTASDIPALDYFPATSSISTVYGGTGLTSYNIGDILYASGPNTLSRLPIGSNSRVLKVVGGLPAWGIDTGGSGGGGAWATTTDDLAIFPADPTQVVLVGSDSTTTTGNILEVTGNALFRNQISAYQAVIAPNFVATSSTASNFPFASSTALTISGEGYFGTASTTNLTISGIANALLKTNSSGSVGAAVAGVDYVTPAALASSYPFPNNATSTLLTFGGGVISQASSTFTGTLNAGALTLANALTVGNGGTGDTSFSYGLVFSPGGTAALQNISTSSLGLLTTDVAEGTNLYFTNVRAQAQAVTVLSATTSLPNITTLAGLSLPYSQLTGTPNIFGYPFPGNATSTFLNFYGGLAANTLSATTSASLASTTLTGNTLLSNATTTNLSILSVASTTGLVISSAGGSSTRCLQVGPDGTVSANASACGTGSGTFDFTPTSIGNATSTLLQLNAGIIALASSTIANLSVVNGTTTNATTTNFAVTSVSGQLLKTLSDGAVVAAQAGVDYQAAGNYATFSYPFPNNATSTSLSFYSGLTASTLTATTSASLASTTLTGNSLFANATSTTLGLLNALTIKNGGTGTSTAPSYGQLLIGDANGNYELTSTSSLGITSGGSSVGYPFPLAGNATSTLTQFNGGLTAFASSTIGNGSATGGLTVSGNATTTGNAYFASTLTVGANAYLTDSSVSNTLGLYGLSDSTIGSLKLGSGGGVISGKSGRIGIGTTNPGDLLQVGDGSADIRLSVESNSVNQFTAKNASGNSVKYGATTDTIPNAVISNNDGNPILTITSAGSVGVGNINPSQKLDVQGEAAAQFFTSTSTSNVNTFPYASSTAFTATNLFSTLASTTNLTISSLGTGGTTCVQADANGNLSSTGSACGSGGGSTVATVSNSDGTLVISPTSGAVVASLNLAHANTFSALQTFGNILLTSSSTLQNFTALNATTSQATTTNLAITGVASSLLKTLSNGAVVAALAGTDYQAAGSYDTFTYPFLNNATSSTLTLGGLLTGTSTVGALNATSSALLASTTLTGNSLFANATSTTLGLLNALTVQNGGTGSTTLGGLLTGNGTGAVTSAVVSSPLSFTGNTLSIQQASRSQSGYLSGTDFTTFDNKISSTSLSSANGFLTYSPSTGVFTASTSPTYANATSTTFFANDLTVGSLSGLVGANNGSLYQIATSTNFVTSLTAGSGITLSGSTGAVTVTNAYGYPFTATVQGESTSTTLLFGNGFISQASSTVSGAFNSTLSNNLASTTLTGNSLFGNATSTSFFASIASSTNLFSTNANVSNLTLANALTVQNGGTGQTSFTSGNLLYGSGTNGVQNVATSSLSVGSSLSVSGTLGAQVGGTNSTLSLNLSNANTWSALQTFGNILVTGSSTLQNFTAVNATTSQATTTNLAITGVTNTLLKTLTNGAVVAAVAGTDYITPSGLATAVGAAYPFQGANNSTSTLTQFNGGLTAYASSTIGNGTATGGLTVSGGATTTGNFYTPGTVTAANFFDTSFVGNNCIGETSGALGESNCVSSIASAGSSLTVSSPTGNVDVSINPAHANFFTALQNFVNASTSELTATSSVYLATAAGAVGIGNTNPQKTLDVTGTGRFSSILTISNTTSCNGSSALQTNASGDISCGTISSSGISTAGGWTTNNLGLVSLATTTYQVLIGASSTSTLAQLEVHGGANFDNATSTNLFGNRTTGTTAAFGGTATTTIDNAGNVGIGTSSPSAHLAVSGGNILQAAFGNPSIATSVATSNHTYDTVVEGRYAYSADFEGGLRITDISNPKNPSVVGSYTGISHAVSVAVAGHYAYLGDTSAGLAVVDVSNPAAPTLVGSAAVATSPFGIALSGKYAYLADFGGAALQIVDISNPAAPALVGSFAPGGTSQPYAVVVQGQYAYVGDAGNAKVYVVDISNPAAPVKVGTYSATGITPAALYISGKYLYAADAAKGFYVLNVANPTSPTLVGSYNPSGSYYGVSVAGNYAYVADHAGNAVVLDVTNPASPQLVGSVATGGSPQGLTVAGKYAYVSAYNGGLAIVDINGASLPSADIGSLATNDINVSDNAQVGGDISAGGGLDVGISGIFSRGTISAYVASSTQVNPVVADFMGGNVGIGTTSPFATLSVAGNIFANGSITGSNITATGTLSVTGQTTLTNASSTALTSTNLYSTLASTTNLNISGIAGALLKTVNGTVTAAVAGTDYLTNAFKDWNIINGYLTPTSTLGVIVNASSTIGNGTQTGGLTISGGATTTGNAYFASNVGIGTTSPWAQFAIQADNGSSYPGNVLLSISSSTASGNSTLLSFNNAGQLTVGPGVAAVSSSTQLSVLAGTTTVSEAGSTTSGLTEPQGVYVQGRYAYVADFSGGAMIIFDVSNPAAPVEVSSISSGLTHPQNIYVQGRYAYVVDSSASSLIIFDVSNPVAPVEVSRIVGTLFRPFSVYVSGRYAYVADTPDLVTFDVSNPAAPVEISDVAGGMAKARSVYVQGRYAYVVDFINGLFDIFDVSNPAAPTNVSISTGLTEPYEVYVQGRYAYIAESSGDALVIYDVSNPAAPVEVSSISSGLTKARSVYVQGRYAYVTDWAGGNFVIYDVSNPAAPVEVSSISSGLSIPWGVYVQGRYAYVADAGGKLVTFDLGGGYIQQLETGGLETGTLSVRNNLSALDGSFAGGLTAGGSLNVTGSGSFTSATSTIGTTANIFNITTASSTNSIFSVLGNGDVGIGTSSPTNIFEVAGNSFLGGNLTATGTVQAPNFLATGSTTLQNFTGVNATTSQATTTNLAITGISGALLKTLTNGAVVAAVAGTDYVTPGGLASAFPFIPQTWGNSTSTTLGFTNGIIANASSTIVNTSFLSNGQVGIGTTSPFAELSIATPNGSTGSQQNLFAIASSSLGGTATSSLLTFDSAGRLTLGQNASSVSSSTQLTVLAGTTTLQRISSNTLTVTGHGVYVQGRYSYIVGFLSGGTGFEIWDISNPSSPVRVSQSTLNQNGGSVYVQGRYAYIVDVGGASNAFEVWDVSNPASPVRVSQTTTSASPRAIYVQGRYAYFTETNNFQIYDVSNPSAPALVATVSTNGTSNFVSVQGRYAYMADNTTTNGFEIWDVSNPAAPVRVSQNTLNANGFGGYVQGDYAYLADGGTTNAFEVWNVSNPTSPTRVSSNTLSANGHAISVQGRYAYIADNSTTNSFETWDISNPAAPVRVSQNTLNANGFAMYVQGRYAYLADGGTTNAFEVWDLGGGYIQQLETGGLETGTLSVRNNLSALDGSFAGGLTAGGSLNVTGSGSFTSATSTIGTTANIFNITTASSTNSIFSVLGNGDVGIGTTTPTNTFEVAGNTFLGGNLIATGTLTVTGTATSTFSGAVTVSLPVGGSFVIGTTTSNHEFDVYGTNNTAMGLSTLDPSLVVTNAGQTVGNGADVAFEGVDNTGKLTTLARIANISTNLTNGSTAGNLAFFTRNAGAQQQDLTILANGQVGIGTTSPFAQLSVDTSNLAAGVPEFDIGSSTRSDFTVTQAGNVGIGTTNPGVLLTINGTGAGTLPTPPVGTGLELVGGRNTPGSDISLYKYVGTPTITFALASGTVAAPTAIGSGKLLSNLNSEGYDGSTFAVGAQNVVQAMNNWSTSDHSTLFEWFTTPKGSAAFPTSVMVLYQGLYVGTGADSAGVNDPGLGSIHATASISASSTLTIAGLSNLVGGILTNASSTLGNFTALNATTSQATTTNLAITGVTSCSGSNALITNSLGSVICGAITASGSAFPFTPSALDNSTSTLIAFTNGLISNASSTFTGTLNAGTLALNNALTVANGGTGQTTFTAGNLLYGSGTNGVQNVATSSLAAGTALSFTGTAGALVGGSNLTINFAAPATSALSIPFASSTAISATGLIQAANFLATASSTFQNFTGVNATTSQATTTNLAITGVGNTLLKTLTNGAVVAAVAGTDYATPGTVASAFPFTPSSLGNSTSTLLLFNQGFISGASSTVSGALNSTLSNNLASTTLTGNSLFTNATSTTFFATIASSTNLFATNANISSLTLANALTVLNGGTGQTSFTAGNLIYGAGAGALQNVATSSFTTNSSLTLTGTAGALVGGTSLTASLNLTNSNVWTALQQFQGDASSSQESIFQKAYFGATATSTFDSAGNLSLVGNGLTVGTNQLVVSSGNVGIGTTSPWAQFSIATPNGATGSQTNLFAIASSSLGGTATTTLLSFNNNGQLTIGPNISAVSNSTQLNVLAGTSSIVRVSQSNLANGAEDNIYIQGRYAYIAETGTTHAFEVFDVSNPASPSRVSQSNLANAGSNSGIFVQGGYAYVAEGDGTTKGFEIFNIFNPASPVRVSQNALANGGVSGNGDLKGDGLYVQGRYAYVAEGAGTTNAFEIFDVSNPASPSRVSQSNLAHGGGHNTASDAIYVQGHYAYIAESDGTTNAFEIFDVSNPASPSRVSQSNLANGACSSLSPDSLYIQGRYVYIAEGCGTTNAFEIFDVSNPASPSRVSQSSLSNFGGNGLYVQGRYAYVAEGAGTTNAFEIFDVSNPASPSRVSQKNLTNGASFNGDGIFVQGRYAYIVEGLGTTNAFEVFDLGGGYIQQLETGGLETGTLSVRNNLSALDGSFAGGLTAGGSLNVTGSGSFVSATSTFNTTANIFNITTASSTQSIFSVLGNGDVGIGTSSPTNLFEVAGNSFLGGNLTATGTVQAPNFLATGSSTLQNFTALLATTSQATTTSLAVTGTASCSGSNALTTNSLGSIICGAITGGSAFPFTPQSWGNSTSTTIGFTNGLIANASSTIVNTSFLSNGQVGIGTTSPWAQLSVDTSNLAAGVPEFAIGSSTRTDLTVTQSGNVGIGTTTPTDTLSANGNLWVTNIGATSYSVFGQAIFNNGAASNGQDFLVIGTSTTGTNNVRGLAATAIYNGATAGANAQAINAAAVLGPSATVSLTANNAGGGLRNRYIASNQSTGYNVAQMSALSASVTDQGTLASSTDNADFHAEAPTINSGNAMTSFRSFWARSAAITSSLTNWAGLDIEGLSSSNASNTVEALLGTASIPSGHFGIYQSDSNNNFLGGALGIGTGSFPANPAGQTVCYNTTSITGADTLGTCSSDENLKHDIEPIAASSSVDMLAAVDALTPSTFQWIGATTTYAGFIAQNVQQSIPLAVAMQPNGFYSLDTTALTAYTVGAIQELHLDLETIASTTASSTPLSQSFAASFWAAVKNQLTSWLGDAGNGLANIFTQTLTATTVNATTVNTQELCLTDSSDAKTCVTKQQLDQLLSGSFSAQGSGGTQQGSGGSGSSDSGSGSDAGSSTPPTITLNGDNPTTINVGDVYSDLGGVVSGPGSDANLQLWASVDGGATTTSDQIQVDTSAVGTHTIIYSATDTNGLMGYASREVDVASSTQP